MNRIHWSILLAAVLAVTGVARGATAGTIDELYTQFVQRSESRTASEKMYDLAKNDQSAREFLSTKLPSIIESRETDIVWIEAVRLSGRLHLESAVPALSHALSRGPVPTYDPKVGDFSTFSRTASLKNDVVGRALADIGDPAVPPVANAMANGDAKMRRRAYWILSEINSAQSQQALRDHLASESDPVIKQAIERKLHISE